MNRRSIAPMATGLGWVAMFASLPLVAPEDPRDVAPHLPEQAPFVPQTDVLVVSISSNSGTAAVGPGFFRIYDTTHPLNREARRHPGGVSRSFAVTAPWTVSFDRLPPAGLVASRGSNRRERGRF